jgi:hypothetical protein
MFTYIWLRDLKISATPQNAADVQGSMDSDGTGPEEVNR